MTTGLIRFNPETDLFRGRMDRLFNQMLNTPWSPAQTEDVTNRGFLPAVDIRETPEQLVISAELPGLDKKDVHITLENRVLTIAGERSFEKEVNNEPCHRIERPISANASIEGIARSISAAVDGSPLVRIS